MMNNEMVEIEIKEQRETAEAISVSHFEFLMA